MFTVKVNGSVLFHEVSFALALNEAMANVADGTVTVHFQGQTVASVDASSVRKANR
jgi:hypothetical protein